MFDLVTVPSLRIITHSTPIVKWRRVKILNRVFLRGYLPLEIFPSLELQHPGGMGAGSD